MALHHASPAEIVDLSPMGDELRNNHTAAIVKTDEFEAVRLVVRAGALLKQHQVPESITLHCLEGRVELGLGDSSVELKANEWLYLEGGVPHSVYGLEDSSILLTIILAKSKEKPRMAAG
ncbi:MAG: cupin domain-containing protein [Hyphomicrobiaceae bacterium]